MGILGGDWVENREPTSLNVIEGQSEYELHTDIDVTFTMSGLTDTGLTFGASIDLDESDGSSSNTNTPPNAEGASAAFDNRAQGGEEIFISGAFGTLTMGDTDGALDWALQEIGIGSTLGDAHTQHAGYNGNSFADSVDIYNDDSNVADGQIARYDHSIGNFAVAISAHISDDAVHEDIFAIGAKYDASFATMDLGLGLGYAQLAHERKDNDAVGVSLDANFKNGFRAILNWVDMGDSYENYAVRRLRQTREQYIGVGLGYAVDDWILAANWGQYSEDTPNTSSDRGQSGYALVVNYDMGGGAEVQLGYANSDCATNTIGPVTFRDPVTVTDCAEDGGGFSRISLGVAMSF